MKKPNKRNLPDSPFLLCPLCPGQALQQWHIEGIDKSTEKTLSVVLDHCPLCSGLWLTSDRLFVLRYMSAEFLQQYIPFRYEHFVACCRSCGAQTSRRATHCSRCQHAITSACVQCHQAMDIQFIGGLQQDRCFQDHGFWLDHLAWIQIWDLPNHYFKDSPFQDMDSGVRWRLKDHQRPSYKLKKQLKQAFAQEISFCKGQGFASDIATLDLSTGQAALGSLGVLGFLGKGALKIVGNFFRIFARLD